MHSIAIFGGTFDPIHNGHLNISNAIQNFFNFDSYLFLPCKIPTLKPPAFASNQQRIEMLELALKDYPQFKIDLREINRLSPSYMVDTLQSFRKEYRNDSITLIMGYDAFTSLPQWHQWDKIIKLANLLIINRVDCLKHPPQEPINQLITNHKNNSKDVLLHSMAGVINFFDAGNYTISSTDIRKRIQLHQSVNNKLPNKVYDYIKRMKLYQ